MKKRLMSILLTACLLVGLLPTVAYAEGGTSHEGWTELTKAILESTYKVSSELGDYYKLPDGHYYLGENISVDKKIEIGDRSAVNNVILDLNGYKLRKDDNTALLFLQNDSTLTVMDNSVTKSGKIISDYAIGFNEGGKFNANGGTIEGNVYLYAENAAIDNTDPSNITVFDKGRITVYYSTAIINGGIFYSTVSNYSGRITGGTFYGTVSGGMIEDSAKVTVTFNSDGGSDVAEQKVLRGQKATEPATAPTKSGYSFEGWYNGDTLYDFNTPVTGNITLTAKWTVNTYTVSFDSQGGSAVDNQTVESGGTATEPTAPTREGYTFAGWYTDASYTTEYNFSTPVTENLTLYAKWTINRYTITFNTDGGTVIDPITQDYGTAVTAPEYPTKTGYTFNGWDKAIPDKMPAGDMTITAQWTVNPYTITYDLDGGTVEGNPDSYTVETDTFTLNNPTKRGYTFTGWSGTGLTGENNLTVTIETGSTGERSYTAHWRYNAGYTPTHPITVESAKHGDVTVSPKNASKGATVTITVEPDKGYTLETLTVTDKDGDEIELTAKGDGKYTFKMPAGKVYVEATFMEDNSMLNFFVDVPADDYYYDAVQWAVENGITDGVDAAHFAPNAPCTRAQIVTFLWRAAGSPAPKSSMMPFTDVPAGSYYETAVLWAAENGITGGTGNNAFSPDAACTRGQIVSFLWRALGSSTVSGSANPFADVEADAYYNTAVLWAAENGITGGTGNNAFSPDADCTRAQIVTFLWRALAE